MLDQNILNEIDQLKNDFIAEEAQDDAKLKAYKDEVQKDGIRKMAQLFEVSPALQDMDIALTIDSSDLVNEPYLLRLHSAFSSQGKRITIICNGITI